MLEARDLVDLLFYGMLLWIPVCGFLEARRRTGSTLGALGLIVATVARGIAKFIIGVVLLLYLGAVLVLLFNNQLGPALGLLLIAWLVGAWGAARPD